jgi:hypothetical protein
MSKKHAEQSFKNLRIYLSRYEEGSSWLETIHRWTVDLRRSLSQAKYEIKKAQDDVKALTDKLNRLQRELNIAKLDEERASARCNTLSRRNKELEGIVAATRTVDEYDGEIPESDDCFENMQLVYPMFQELRRHFIYGPPEYSGIIRDSKKDWKSCPVVPIHKIVDDIGTTQATLIGQFIFVMTCLLGMTIAVAPAPRRRLASANQSVVDKFSKWVEPWFVDGHKRMWKCLQSGNNLDANYRKTMDNISKE